jgi:hypothetical protein
MKIISGPVPGTVLVFFIIDLSVAIQFFYAPIKPNSVGRSPFLLGLSPQPTPPFSRNTNFFSQLLRYPVTSCGECLLVIPDRQLEILTSRLSPTISPSLYCHQPTPLSSRLSCRPHRCSAPFALAQPGHPSAQCHTKIPSQSRSQSSGRAVASLAVLRRRRACGSFSPTRPT